MITDIEEVTGISYNVVREYLNALHAKKVIYISGWEKDAGGRLTLRKFSFRDREQTDKPRPRLTSTERSVGYRSRRRLRLIEGSPLAQTAGERYNASASPQGQAVLVTNP